LPPKLWKLNNYGKQFVDREGFCENVPHLTVIFILYKTINSLEELTMLGDETMANLMGLTLTLTIENEHFQLLSAAPKLKKLSIVTKRSGADIGKICRTWPNLYALSIKRFRTLPENYDVICLERMTRLKELTLIGLGIQDISPQPD
jgi:hypothetical protein